MKIVVVSDTHGDISALKRVCMLESDADLYLHAGDIAAPPESIFPFLGVQGNADAYFREDYRFFYESTTPYGRIHMEHRPIESPSMISYLKNEGVRIVVHGHTHVREQRTIDGVLVVCPGSLVLPRDNLLGTYLVLEVSATGVKTTFKEL